MFASLCLPTCAILTNSSLSPVVLSGTSNTLAELLPFWVEDNSSQVSVPAEWDWLTARPHSSGWSFTMLTTHCLGHLSGRKAVMSMCARLYFQETLLDNTFVWYCWEMNSMATVLYQSIWGLIGFLMCYLWPPVECKPPCPVLWLLFPFFGVVMLYGVSQPSGASETPPYQLKVGCKLFLGQMHLTGVNTKRNDLFSLYPALIFHFMFFAMPIGDLQHVTASYSLPTIARDNMLEGFETWTHEFSSFT